VLLAAGTYMAVHTLLFGVMWRAYMNWYALAYLAAYALVVGLVLPAWWDSARCSMRSAGLVVIPIVVFAGFLYVRFLDGIDRGQTWVEEVFWDRFEVLGARYPEGVLVGGFNAGAVGYFAPSYGDITVINLDGLVNNEAYAAARQGRLSEYVLEHVEVMLEPFRNGGRLFREGELDSLESTYQKWPGHELWSRGPPPSGP
jgi:hypothetical protein